MTNRGKSKAALSAELEALRQRLATLESTAAQRTASDAPPSAENSDRKNAEEAMRRARDELEQKVRERTAELSAANDELRIFRMFAEASGLGFGMADLDGYIVYWNPTLCRMFGEDNPDRAIGRHVTAYYSTEYFQKRQAEIIPQALQGGYWQGELTVCSPDGQATPILQNTFIIRDEAGIPIRLGAAITDISERKRAEQALRQSHDELRAIYDGMQDGLLIADVETKRFVRCNAAMCRMLGYSEQEIAGRSVMDIHPAEEMPKILEHFRKLIAGEESTAAGVPVLRKDGSLLYADISHHEILYNGRFCSVGFFHDITKSKVAEDALRDSEEKYKTLVETSPDAVIMTDLNGRIVFASRRTLEMYGAQHLDEMLGKDPRDFFASQDHAKLLANLRRTVDEGSTRSIEYSLLRKDGQGFAGEVSAAVIRDASGRPNGLVAILRDITERKQTQAALAASEQKYRQLVETTGTGYLILDARGRVIDANPEYVRISGHSRLKEIQGRAVTEWTAPYDLQRNLGELEKCVDLGFVRQLEIDYLHTDGRTIPVEINATCLDTPDGRRIVVLCRDVSERRQSQDALQQSHDELRAIYESIGDGLLVADRKTARLIRANAAICGMLGYAEEELLTKSITDLHPPEVTAQIIEALRGNAPRHLPGRANVPMLRKDGSVFLADITGDTFAYQGQPCALGVFRDVTERHRAHEALERERRTLQHMLQASDHERQLIAYDIHDGLAQELAGAIMQFQIYELQKDASPEDAQRAFTGGVMLLKQAHAEARRLISGVRPPILDESGVMAAVSHLIHDPAYECQPAIELRTRVSFVRLPAVLENVIYRIVQEGLANARNHSQSPRIRVSLVQRKNRLRIEIRDWGVGFDPLAVPESHFGLDGIRERARLLGGRCNIKSKPGRGTTVIVELPVTEQRRDGETE